MALIKLLMVSTGRLETSLPLTMLASVEEVGVDGLGLGFGEAADGEGGAGGGDGEGNSMGEPREGGAA